MKKRAETVNFLSLRNIIILLIVIIVLVIISLLIFSGNNKDLTQNPEETSNSETNSAQETPPSAPETTTPSVVQTEFCMDALEFEKAGWCPRNSITQKRMVPQGACVTDAGKPGVFCK